MKKLIILTALFLGIHASAADRITTAHQSRDAEIKTIPGGKVLHITSFTNEDEAEVKAFTMQILLNKRAYKNIKRK